LVAGHRGTGAETGAVGVLAPEDTVAAVRAAIVIGLDYVETDPRATMDGFLVNVADEDVDRTTDGTGLVADLTLAEIKSFHLDGAQFAGDFSCERVPTLQEILLAAKGKIHVLVDANKTDQVDLLVQAIQETDTLDWAVFDTENLDKINQALALEPALHILGRVGNEAELTMVVNQLATHPPIMIEVYEGGDTATLVPAIHAVPNRALINTLATDFAAGLSGDPSLYQEKWDLDPNMVMSDRPDLVLQFLDRWPPPPQP
jgi:glycerophosphoryl diester phosphodiesterase